jgi:hypothetical protein
VALRNEEEARKIIPGVGWKAGGPTSRTHP